MSRSVVNSRYVTDGVDNLYAVIPAAGSGQRMNSAVPKQYLTLDGVTVLQRTVSRMLEIKAIKKVVVVVDQDGGKNIDSVLQTDDRVDVCIGGDSRAESVRNGLRYLQSTIESGLQLPDTDANTSSADNWVLVHDAARPCVRTEDISLLIQSVYGSNDGGLLARPVTDTIKKSDSDGRIEDTVDRNFLWSAATPQMFRLDKLLDALQTAIENQVAITDEASAMQRSGYRPALIECHSDNIKITTSSDLVLAQHYLQAQLN